jgi:hypothetical protein
MRETTKRLTILIVLMSAGSATVCIGLAAGAFAPLALPAVEPLLAASVLVAGLIALGWLAGRNARLRKLAPALVTLAGAGLLGLA